MTNLILVFHYPIASLNLVLSIRAMPNEYSWYSGSKTYAVNPLVTAKIVDSLDLRTSRRYAPSILLSESR